MSKLLSKESILRAEDLKVVDERVAEWPDTDGQPGVVRFRQMSADESMKITKLMVGESGADGMFIILVASAIDEAGEPLFTMEDIAALRGKSMKVLNRLQRVCLRLNSMIDSEVDLKKD